MKFGSKLSAKHQVSIPKGIRDQFSSKPGQEFVFIPKGNGVLMMPAPEREAPVGIARGANLEGYRDRDDRF